MRNTGNMRLVWRRRRHGIARSRSRSRDPAVRTLLSCDGRRGWCGGPARHGVAQWGGPARHGSAQGGPARHGSAQGGPARHGSAQGGPARRLCRGDGGRRGDGGPARTGCTLSYLHRLLWLLKSGLHVGERGESVQEINSVCETSFFLLTVCDKSRIAGAIISFSHANILYDVGLRCSHSMKQCG
jgi:hypothetical protein